MRKIRYEDIVTRVATICQEANYELGQDVIHAFEQAVKKNHRKREEMYSIN